MENRKDNDLDYINLIYPLWHFLSLSEKPVVADAIFVFGCIDMQVPAYAMKLWKGGFSKKILLTGESGVMKSSEFNGPEAVAFANYMQENGVPDSDIVIEPTAKNTGENVRFGMEMLAKNNITPKSLLLVSRPFCMQRCAATFKKQFPNVKTIACPVEGDVIDFIDRPKPEFALRLVSELDRLKRYPEQGFTVPIEIPIEISELATLIFNTYNK
ncbi:MAG: hypothetical protein PWQ10_322 [Patescibacteria group bacterium]|nr:hypothetical protein [Patescibacteria group bacterium]